MFGHNAEFIISGPKPLTAGKIKGESKHDTISQQKYFSFRVLPNIFSWKGLSNKDFLNNHVVM